MKKLLVIKFFFMAFLVFFTSCNNENPVETIDKQSVEKGSTVTVTVNYPYTATGTIYGLTQYTSFGDHEGYNLYVNYNGIPPGGYLGYLRQYRASVSYAFPNGVSAFTSSPWPSLSSNIPQTDVTRHSDGLNYPIGSVFRESWNSSSFGIKTFLLYCTYRIYPTQQINKYYSITPANANISYQASGRIEKSTSEFGQMGKFTIDLGVTGLTMNDVVLTCNNSGFFVTGSISGSILSGKCLPY